MAELKILPYYQKFLKDFEKEKQRISNALRGDDIEIHHIGSTAVPRLGGKGIIDIMLGINTWKDLGSIIEKLKIIGFKHIHPKEKGRVFLSKTGATKLGDVHIHIVKKGGKVSKDLLLFRDCLRNHKKEAEKYFNLKLKWSEEFKGDRKKYTKEKVNYVKDILRKVYKHNKKSHVKNSSRL